jgi:hypothetical protein
MIATAAAQMTLYVGVGVILLATVVPRAHGADQPLGRGLTAPASTFAERLQTEHGHELNYDPDLAGPYGQIQEEGKKQELLLTDDIALRLDGILCHALSVFALLYSVTPWR